jgi:hypothetical protein
MMKIHVQCIEALAEAFVESHIAAYRVSGLLIDAEDVERIINELRGCVEKWFASLRSQPNIGRFLTTQPSDPRSVVARCRQVLTLELSKRKLAEERATTGLLQHEILEKMDEQPGITRTLAQLKRDMPDCLSLTDVQWFTALDDLRKRGLVSSPTPAGPFLMTQQGQRHIQALQQKASRTQDTIMGDKYEIHGQAGAVGPHAHVHDVDFVQLWNHVSPSTEVDKLAEELSRLREAMRARATAPEHDVAIGAVASAEIEAQEGRGPRLLEHLSKAGKWALDCARELGVQMAAEAIKRASGL